MSTTNLRIIEELRFFVLQVSQDKELTSLFSLTPRGFTRNRKLGFLRTVLLIGKLCKKTLSVELESFFEEMGSLKNCSVSAFCQQRKKLNPLFYRVWNEVLCTSFYALAGSRIKTWQGYKLIAVDGSNVSLIDTPSISKHFGGQRNQHDSFIQGKSLYAHDVLNNLVIHAQIAPYSVGELVMAYNWVNGIKPDMLTIYDRNFCNYKMMALLSWQETERKFVIRAREKWKPISNFIKSGRESEVIAIYPSPNAIEGLYECGYKITAKTPLKVRLVRVELPNSVEVIATNLWNENLHPTDFKSLYFKRWGIETNISHQKNILRLESFSGLSKLAVEQEFYATIFMANLHAVITHEAQKTLDNEPKKRKHRMKVNGNKSHGKLREAFVSLFTRDNLVEILMALHNLFIRDPLPQRPNRSYQRVVKNKQTKSKHKTCNNYKPAF